MSGFCPVNLNKKKETLTSLWMEAYFAYYKLNNNDRSLTFSMPKSNPKETESLEI